MLLYILWPLLHKEDFPIRYATGDDAVAMVTEYGKGCIKAGKLPDQHWSDTHQVLPTPCNAEIPRSGDMICKEIPVSV